MATIYWLGKAEPVAQVTTVTVGGVLAGETFTISVNSEAIASFTDTSHAIADTVAALVAAWNASTNPYASGITAADASPNITLTADTKGVPFTITLNTPGGAATFTQAATTASAGPNHWDVAANWSGGAVPVGNDTVILKDSSVNICWGLDQNAVDLTTLRIWSTYTGRIGLNKFEFATSADGETTVTTKSEYRTDYLKIGWTTADIGLEGPIAGTGSDRLKLYNDIATASTTTVFSANATSAETGLPSVRLYIDQAGADIRVYSAIGGVGLNVDPPPGSATININNVYIGDESDSTTVWLHGELLGTLRQMAGTCVIAAAASYIDLHGGTLVSKNNISGFTIGEVTVNGGTFYCANIPSSGDIITTLTQTGGTIDFDRMPVSRSISTYNQYGGTFTDTSKTVIISTKRSYV